MTEGPTDVSTPGADTPARPYTNGRSRSAV